MSSPFLELSESHWVASNALAFAIRDKYPVSPGHTLVIPRRLVASWFDASAEEQRALLELVDVVKRGLEASGPPPDGYNLGINVGAAAGQTVAHLHVHVIPRYQGDMADPRGGVRHVIPSLGNYLRTPVDALATGGVKDPFLQHLAPLFLQATDISILAAFVQDSGLAVLSRLVREALSRGARVRVLTGDYLSITQASALRQLLDWMGANEARREAGAGVFEARIVETMEVGTSFHPKSWRFEGPGLAVAFVGSSNLSHSALKTGIEWNLPVERDQNPRAYAQAVEAFEQWWSRARRFDAQWVARYEREAPPRALQRLRSPEADGVRDEPVPPTVLPEPHEIQRQALAALERSHQEGKSRALVILATGLGKTLLAAWDIARVAAGLGRAPRVLFLAHRAELLTQAEGRLRAVLPSARFGWFIGARDELEADVVLASVQKLWRPESLAALRRTTPFDYVVIDEVHHAAAPRYRDILATLESTFLLGLTATPERSDKEDISGLFDDNVVYRADLAAGIERQLLVPFAYHGLKDDIAYENIPWRNRRFDPAKLAEAVQTDARMKTLWAAWTRYPATRTLVFCVSVPHAMFVRDWLRRKNVRVVAVHSGEETDDRAKALSELARGELDAICTVDLFNEGIDLPSVDRVVMLRPTESTVIFMQQLGRGLRRAEGKQSVTVIDFVGNHRMFRDRLETLLSLGPGAAASSLQEYLVDGQPPELPPGCSVEVELEAKEMLAKLEARGSSNFARMYRELRRTWGRRPTCGEMYQLGYLPSVLKGGWFSFVGEQGDLTSEEVRALENRGGDWFETLERTPMSKSFKMVVLLVLLDANALDVGMSLSELSSLSARLLERRPELGEDLEGVKALEGSDTSGKTNPLSAWTGDAGWFRIEGERFVSRLPMTVATRDAFQDMTRELVNYRLAKYLGARGTAAVADGFEAKVSHNAQGPILRLRSSRDARPDIPQGATPVTLPDGSQWTFKFVKIAINTAWPSGAARENDQHINRLPELLRQWFGPRAGESGSSFHVRFHQDARGWRVEPLGAAVLALPARRAVVAFPSLKAAAGAASGSLADAPEQSLVHLPVARSTDGLFAVRASGDSMAGGAHPIRDGDWLMMQTLRGVGLGALDGQIVLVQVPDAAGHAYQVKRLVQRDAGWWLRSENPASPSLALTEDRLPLARLVQAVPPESLAPFAGVYLDEEGLEKAFGLSATPRTGRVQGHLFLCVEEPGGFSARDRLASRFTRMHPGETAFVLSRTAATHPWRYAGLAHWSERDEAWTLPEPVDDLTWQALGTSPRET